MSQDPPTLEGRQFPPIPFTRAVALDPWLEPLPTPGPTPFHIASSLKDQPVDPPKLLVINSESFTLWKSHFARLQALVRTWNTAAEEQTETRDGDSEKGPFAYLITLVRAKHVSFSDFGVVVPFGSMHREGRKFLDVICDMTDAFLNQGFEDVLHKQQQVDGKVEVVDGGKKGHTEERFVGNVGDIIVH